jgi:hypothetical protein
MPAGRPRFKPTDDERKQVEAMAGYGVPFAMISSLIRGGIDEDTLNRHFGRELSQGKAKACAKVGQSLFQRATSGDDTTAAIWWTKTQMGWKDTSRHELLISGKLDLGGLRADDLDAVVTNP